MMFRGRQHQTRARARAAIPLAGAVAVATAAATVGMAPAGASELATTDVRVICDGVGEDVVTITGDLSDGGTATIAQGPLTVVGTPGFTGTTAKGATVTVAPTGTGVTCTATGTTTADSLDETLPARQAARSDEPGAVTGHLTFTVEVDEQAALGSPSREGTSEVAGSRFPFEASLKSYLDGRPGAVGVAVRVPGTSRVYTYTKSSSRNVTASIVKVQVMAAVMLRAQDAGRSLTSWEKSKIVPMIRYSDNNATTELFNNLGGRAALDRAGARLGMTSTYANDRWGLTSTVPVDQTRLMEHFARATGVLSSTNRSYGLTQMRSIASDQDWGVTAGPPSGTVALKNGWLPRTDGWHVNSIGSSTYGQDYTIAVLTHDNPGSMGTEISTIEGVSRIVYRYRSSLVPTPTPPKTRGVRGDVDGDGKVDLLGASASKRVYLYKGLGGGDLAPRTAIKAAPSDATWFGTAGDLNRDRRSDLLVRRGDGRLQLWMSSGTSSYGSLTTVGIGFGSFTSIAAGTDIDGNGRLDLVTRRVGGYASHYEMSDTGKVSKVRDMGRPFQWYPRLLAASDLDGDGKADLRAVSTGGRMRAWRSTGTAWSMLGASSEGWDAYAAIASPGDLNGAASNQADVVALRSDDALRAYWGSTTGSASGPVGITPSGAGMTQLF